MDAKKEKKFISPLKVHFWGSTAYRTGCQCKECKRLLGKQMEREE